MSSLLADVCTTAALALAGTVGLIYLGVSSFNKEAREKGLTEKGYSLGSVVMGAAICFITLFISILYALFVRVR